MAEQKQMAVNRMVRPAGPRPAAAAALTPKEVFGILRRHVLLIVALTMLGSILGGAGWYLLLRYLPKYTAETFIKVLPPIDKDPMTIGAAMVQKDIQYGHRVSMVARLKHQSTLQKLIERDKVKQTKWFKSFGEVRHRSIVKAVRYLERKFRANAQRDGDSIVVSMTCGDKEEAALIVNEMVSLFLASQKTTELKGITDRLEGLHEERKRVLRDLQGAEQALQEVRDRWRIDDLEIRPGRQFEHIITLRLNALELDRNDIVLQTSQLRSVIETLDRQATGAVAEQVESLIERDPTVVLLTQQLVALKMQLAGRLAKFGENHRVVRQTQEAMNETRARRQHRKAEIAELTRRANVLNARDALTTLTDRLEKLDSMIEEAAAKKKDLDMARIQYEQRLRIRDERQEMLDAIKEQVEKLNMVRDDPETPKVQFVGWAPEPLEVSSPRWEFYLPGGPVLGLLFGLGLAFLVELLNDLVRTARDVSRYLHIPLLGVIPDAAEDRQLRDVELCHVVRQAPYSIISESYRRFRTNLKLSASAESLKLLLVTSGAAGDGKTSVAVNLAAALIDENKKVLLIDANFRQPNLHELFPRAEARGAPAERSEFGLSTLLAGLCTYEDAKRSNVIEGLDIVYSGPLPSNPTELLDTYQMQQLIKDRRNSHDYIIIDAPPVLLVSDAKVLARLVDGTVLVFNAGATRRGAAQRTIRELRDIDAKIIGCVLLAVKTMKGGYFQEQFKSYQKYQELQLAHTT